MANGDIASDLLASVPVDALLSGQFPFAIVFASGGIGAAAELMGKIFIYGLFLAALVGIIVIFYLTAPATPKLPGSKGTGKTPQKRSMSPFDNEASLEKFAEMHRKVQESRARAKAQMDRANEVSPSAAIQTLKAWMDEKPAP